MTDYGHDIEKYLKGELTAAERHALEKKALNDPFLADALEGAEQLDAHDFLNDVARLNEQLTRKKSVSVWMWTARIAAGLAFILVATFIVWKNLETEPARDLALKNNKPEEVSGPAGDSVTSPTGALSSPPAEQPAAGPKSKDETQPQQPATPQKTEPKPQVADTKPEEKSGEVQTKNEPVAEAVATREAEEKAKEKIDEIRVTESLAQSVKGPESYQSKDDGRASGLSKKKAAAAEAPSSFERSAGAASLQQRIIRGKVTSAEDGSAIPGVNVIVKGTTLGTATDADGNYEMVVPADKQTLSYSFIGQQTKEQNIDSAATMDVQLQRDQTQLSEVVVTAMGVERQTRRLGYATSTADDTDQKVAIVDLAHPEIGNRAFKQYLEKNIRYPEQAKTNKVDGRVTVEFTIEPNGSLSNFTIIRGIGSGCDEELIRLIKEGPKWIPTKKDNVPVQDKAKVRLKFELPK